MEFGRGVLLLKVLLAKIGAKLFFSLLLAAHSTKSVDFEQSEHP
jgi:hypothetical protein